MSKINLIKKWAEDLSRHFFQRKHINSQQVHEKIVNVTNHLGNANQNQSNEISLHTCSNDYHQEDKNFVLVGM